MININENNFAIHTANTSLIMRVMPTGHVEQLYYGKRIDVSNGIDSIAERHRFPHGNSNNYDSDHPAIVLQDICLDFGTKGKGDNREPSFAGVNTDGSRTFDFVFDGVQMADASGVRLKTMPCSYDDEDKEQSLVITLKEKSGELAVDIVYTVYEECDVITRRVKLNKVKRPVRIERLMSGQLDLHDSEYVMTTFNGAWAREMRRVDVPLVQGRHVGGSNAGTSSSNANPFFMLSRPWTTEDTGEAYGFNLVYSGNHYEAAEVNEFFKTRVVWGINPDTFSWTLEKGENFEAPEAVMTYSDKGFNGMSANMHKFVRKHIVRGIWRDKERPVLLNSWEAAYFDINEKKLLKLAEAGKNVGIELFVMDDGWFGEREDDKTSLGDWYPNKKKLPEGVGGIAEKVNKLGLKFGLWVEPEMVNVRSKLYEKHPDWTLEIPGREHTEGRNQRILDLSKREVQDYIIKAMAKVFLSGNVEYVKWDMNRIMTDVYSQGTPAAKQGETAHRYVLGLYRVMRILTKRFPDILFEGCSAGGNRFDLGILSYFPQIWASDDTDAIARADIQCGYSYGYPLSTVGAHVSGVPNHQTLRNTPLETRFNVAAFGVLGYELNLCDLSKEELEKVRDQIALYKEWRSTFFGGTFYRGRTFAGGFSDIRQTSVIAPSSNNLMEWTVVSEDKEHAVSMLLQRQVIPNMQNQSIRIKGLDEEKTYRFMNNVFKINIMDFGDLVNAVAPVHVKQGGVVHSLLAKFVKFDSEREDVTAKGCTLMNAGVSLAPAYGDTGLDDKVRTFPDYASRLYFMEAQKPA